MTSRWFAHLDAHIATGQVAVEAESAELLSELLQLEPEQRWCLVLRRDPRLVRLVPTDYRRLLTLMVELETSALAAAPIPPQPCTESRSKQLALPAPQSFVPHPPGRARRIAWFLAFAVVVSGLSLLSETGQRTLARFNLAQMAWWPTSSHDAELARQQQAMTAFVVLETLSKKLAEGQSFADELAVLKKVWPDPVQLAFLDPLVAPDAITPLTLRAELARLNATAAQQRDESARSARSGYPALGNYYGRVQTLDTLHTQADTALTQVSRDDWRAALESLREVTDPAYRAWCERAEYWLAVREAVSSLARQAWSQWTTDLPNLATAPPP